MFYCCDRRLLMVACRIAVCGIVSDLILNKLLKVHLFEMDALLWYVRKQKKLLGVCCLDISICALFVLEGWKIHCVVGNEKYFPCQSCFQHKQSAGEPHFVEIMSTPCFFLNLMMSFVNLLLGNMAHHQQQLAPSPPNQRRQTAPVMSKPVMLPQTQAGRPDPHRPAVRSDGLVRNTPHSRCKNLCLAGKRNRIITYLTLCNQLRH